MNKAQEKAYQAEVLSKTYDYIENLRDNEMYKVNYNEERMNEELKNDENFDTEYYTNNIDEAKQKTKVIEKVMEMVYKLMQGFFPYIFLPRQAIKPAGYFY